MGRALDCRHPDHEDIHFTAENDEELFGKIQEHRDQYHPDMSDDDIRQDVLPNAYEESVP